MRDVSNSEDILDSRDIEERISELESECSAEDVPENLAELTEELDTLLALRAECDGYVEDWKYGATLIRDSYFEDYARQTAEDIGAIDRNASWPLHCIDWEQAARVQRFLLRSNVPCPT